MIWTNRRVTIKCEVHIFHIGEPGVHGAHGMDVNGFGELSHNLCLSMLKEDYQCLGQFMIIVNQNAHYFLVVDLD